MAFGVSPVFEMVSGLHFLDFYFYRFIITKNRHNILFLPIYIRVPLKTNSGLVKKV